jgi:predicted flap endonuclease-1-like 5' DNA nuclease
MASIDAIEGIGHRNATKLRKARVRTTEALLKTASTRTGRRRLAVRTNLPEKSILQWVNRADLMRVKGVGSEYSDLLEAAGVDTIKELRRRNPANLLDTMVDINQRRRLVRRLPTESMVSGWVNAAKDIDPLVAY